MTSPSSANRDANIVVSHLVSPKGNKKPKKDEISEININKYKEADFVGRETIDLINKEAEVSEIDASHFNKTDRFGSKAHMLTEEQKSDLSKDHHRVKSGLAGQKKEALQEQVMSGPLPATTKGKKDVKL